MVTYLLVAYVKIPRYVCKFYATKTRNEFTIPYMFIRDFTVYVQYATLRTLIIETTRNNERNYRMNLPIPYMLIRDYVRDPLHFNFLK